MKLTKICLLVVVFLSYGCASIPPVADMRMETEGYALPALPAQGKAMIYVVRPSMVGWVVRFNVFVGDMQPASEVGYTRGGQYIYFDVEPGQHQIHSHAGNWAERTVVVEEGEVVFLQQKVIMGMPMANNTLLKLDDVEGKYFVKTLSKGTVLETK